MPTGLDVMTQVRRINKNLMGIVDKCEGPIEQTLFSQASLVAGEIKSVAPVDETSPTPGALKESVRVEAGAATAKKAYVVKIKAGSPSTDKAGYNYARGIEFSTQKMPARPFFFPIWRARRKDVRLAVRKAIKGAVRRVFS